MNKEIRSNDNLEFKDNLCSGYAVVFNSPSSQDLGFIEIIHRGAITQETINKSDVLAKFNHEQVLARCKYGKGSLQLEVDERGLFYSFEIANTQVGNELRTHLQRGDLNQSSFAFSIDKNNPKAEKWTKRADGLMQRDIYLIDRLYDISPVWFPCYEETTASLRYNEVKAQSEEIDKILSVYENEIENL